MTSSVESIGPAPAARGRPRSAAVEEAILLATIQLLVEDGLDGTTINAVAARSNVARATIYLRWSGRDALIAAALRHAIGRQPYAMTGDLVVDIHGGAEQALAILSQPLLLAVLPALVRGWLRRDQTIPVFAFDTLFPARPAFAEEYRREAGRQGLRTDIDGEVVVDTFVGGLLMQLLATGKPPAAASARQIVDVLVAGLRRDA